MKQQQLHFENKNVSEFTTNRYNILIQYLATKVENNGSVYIDKEKHLQKIKDLYYYDFDEEYITRRINNLGFFWTDQFEEKCEISVNPNK